MILELDTSLVKAGIAAVYTKEKFDENRKITLEDAANYTLKANQAEKIKIKFLDEPNLVKHELATRDIVLTHIPTGSYSPGSIQVVAIRREIATGAPIELENGRVPTRFIYDFPEQAQVEYFFQILAGCHVINREFSDHAHGSYRVLFTENAASIVSNEKYRAARTIAEPHSQIWIANGNTKPFDTSDIPVPLQHERQIIRIIKNQLIVGMVALASDLAEKTLEKNDYKIRNAPPFGYVITTSINQSINLSEQAQKLSLLMRAHHQRYQVESTRIINQLKNSKNRQLAEILFPQPSYKVFGTFNDQGFLEISIAPSLFASAGVVEVLNRQIYRDPANVPFFASQETENQYYGSIAANLEQTQKFN